MRKIVILLFGPPGAGKGTQATLLADKLGLVHFDTGRFLESIVHDPERQKEKIVTKERRLWETGILNTPSWVIKEVSREVKKIWRADEGLIFSGSPRTLFEARKLLPVLEKLYGQKKIFAAILKIPPADSIKRNSRRVVCSVCRAPLLTAYYPSKNPRHCPVCAGPFYKRTLDKPEIIKVRLNEYRERTEPIFELMKKRGYKMLEIDGRVAPYKVFGNILKKLKL